MGKGMEEFLKGYQIFWPRFTGVSNILEKIIKYLMGCEILECDVIFLQQKLHLFLLCSLIGKEEVI